MEQRDELQRALAELSREERDAIALRYGADLTIPEIAKLLGEPKSTARGRVISRAAKASREDGEPGLIEAVATRVGSA